MLADLGGPTQLELSAPEPSPSAQALGAPPQVAGTREGHGSLASGWTCRQGLPGGSSIRAGAVLSLGTTRSLVGEAQLDASQQLVDKKLM